MIVREMAGDERGVFLISMSNQKMFSLILPSPGECAAMTKILRLAIGKCPDEGNLSRNTDILVFFNCPRLEKVSVTLHNEGLDQIRFKGKRIVRCLNWH